MVLSVAPFECSGESNPLLNGQTFMTDGLSPLVQQSLGVTAFKVRGDYHFLLKHLHRD